MHLFEILYMLSTTVSLVSSIPQARRLVIAKRSDELSLATWCAWLGTQLISFAYALSIAQPALIFANIGWLTFYVVMVTLILYYRRPSYLAQLAVAADDTE